MNRFGPRSQGIVATTLCTIAGFVDAIAYLKSDVFVANMTGNTVLIGIALARQDWAISAFRIAAVASFFLGAVAGRMLLSAIARRPWVPLLAEAALVAAAVAVPTHHWLWTSLLATAMGVQATALTRFGGISINTVVVTGAIARVAEHVAEVILGTASGKKGRADALQGGLQAGAWAAYGAGAVAATWAAGFAAALWLPASCIVVLAIVLATPDRYLGGLSGR